VGVRVPRPTVSRAAAGFSAIGAVVYWVGVSPWCPLEGSLRFLAAGVVRRPCFVPFPSESAELARLGGRPHHLGLLHLVVSSLSCAVAVATDFVSSVFDRGFQRSWALSLGSWGSSTSPCWMSRSGPWSLGASRFGGCSCCFSLSAGVGVPPVPFSFQRFVPLLRSYWL
jgi:hypothetical protein